MKKSIHVMFSSTLLLLLLSTGRVALAAEDFADALITDRPDAAESSQTVGKDRVQIETSVQYSQDDSSGTELNIFSFPTLLRYGFTTWAELRVEGELITVEKPEGLPSDAGFADLAFGLKGHFVDGGGIIPSLGLLLNIETPVGDAGFTADATQPEIKLLTDWELPADFSLAANNGIDLPARDSAGDRFARYLYAVALGHPLPLLPERTGLFVELTGAFPLKSGKDEEHSLDTGVTFLVTPDFQLDSFVQIGLNDSTADITTGIGFSWRV